MRSVIFAGAALSLMATGTAAFAIEPNAMRGQDVNTVREADDQPKVGGLGGIFGCSAEGSKQGIGAAAGGALGAILGNRIAGRGSRFLGTIIGGALGAAAGSAVGCKLQKNDQAKAERAVQDAVLTGEDQSWTSAETGASGSVAVAEEGTGVDLANIRLARGVDPADGYSRIGASYVAASNANIRSAPGTGAMVLGKLATGQRVWVPAQVQGQPWLLISDGGVGRGYVSAPLMRRAVAENVASGCKLVKQTVNMPGQAAQTETLQACKGSDGQWSMTRV